MFFQNLPKGFLSNKAFAESDGNFQNACEKASPPVKPTARQASKYRNGKGSAFAAQKKGS